MAGACSTDIPWIAGLGGDFLFPSGALQRIHRSKIQERTFHGMAEIDRRNQDAGLQQHLDHVTVLLLRQTTTQVRGLFQ